MKDKKTRIKLCLGKLKFTLSRKLPKQKVIRQDYTKQFYDKKRWAS
jgi:hypothetical protein